MKIYFALYCGIGYKQNVGLSSKRDTATLYMYCICMYVSSNQDKIAIGTIVF